MQIRFDRGPDGQAAWFAAPVRMIHAHAAAEVPAALDALDLARAQGLWVAGYASYELGYVLEPRLADLLPVNRRLPLIAFGVYDAPVDSPPLGSGPALLGPFDCGDGNRIAAADLLRFHGPTLNAPNEEKAVWLLSQMRHARLLTAEVAPVGAFRPDLLEEALGPPEAVKPAVLKKKRAAAAVG